MNKVRLPPAEWRLVWQRTLVILAASTVGSWVMSNLVMMSLNEGMNTVGTVLALGMPTALGGPILLFLQVRSAQLREANRKLELLATDRRRHPRQCAGWRLRWPLRRGGVRRVPAGRRA